MDEQTGVAAPMAPVTYAAREPVADRVGQVTEQVDGLTAIIDDLETTCSRLEDRLMPVLTAPEAVDPVGPEEPPKVDLAERLDMQRQRLVRLNTHLISLRRRVEV